MYKNLINFSFKFYNNFICSTKLILKGKNKKRKTNRKYKSKLNLKKNNKFSFTAFKQFTGTLFRAIET